MRGGRLIILGVDVKSVGLARYILVYLEDCKILPSLVWALRLKKLYNNWIHDIASHHTARTFQMHLTLEFNLGVRWNFFGH